MPKSQAAVADLFIAFFLFIIVLSATIYTWNLYITRIDEERENNEITMKAFQAAEALVKSQGIPENWSLSNVNLTGLAENERILSFKKVDLFVNLTEEQIKNIFKIQLYNFSFVLKDIEGNKIKEIGSITGEKSVNVKRYVVYENEPAILEFKMGK